jgi:hypothetical protein
MNIGRLTILTELCVKNSVQFCGKESNVILLFADKLIEQIQAENKRLKKDNEWISVEDRLPESGTRVLIYVAKREAIVQWYNAIAKDNGLTHWKPLPKPPQDKEDKL